MIVHGMTHFCGNILFHAFAVHRGGMALLKGDRVDFRIAGFAPGRKTGVVYDDRFRLMFADGGVQRVFLPVRAGLAPIAVEP